MSNLHDLLVKIPPPMSVAIDCDSKLPIIISFKLTLYNLQMAYYWLKDANDQLELSSYEEVLLDVGASEEHHIVLPTMIGIPKQVMFIDEKLRELAASTQEVISQEAYPPSVQYKLEQGYNKVMEAIYSNEISKANYDEYTRERKVSKSRDGGTGGDPGPR